MIALRWLAEVAPDLQAGKALLTPIESWDSNIFATVSSIPLAVPVYPPVQERSVQIDVWGRPSPEGQYRGVPLNQCDSIVEYLHECVQHFNPLVIDMSPQYRIIHLGEAETTDMASAYAEKPPGATVSLARARLTINFVYTIS